MTQHQQFIAKANASVQAARARIAQDDPHRPRFHFLPPANWMNDPNGFIQWKRRYHLFYQHNPSGPLWGDMHWGHAISDDLVRWKHLPIALAPAPGSPDKDGIWSGCIVDNAGVPTAVYTGARPECQCLATSHDDLLTWEKHPGNPVIATPPPGFEVGFRDPWAWREGDEWLMAVGSGRTGAGGAALLYRSRDLVRWEYLHPLCEGDERESGCMWECPFFFPLGGKWVLVIHPVPLGRAIYFVGRYSNRRFVPETRGAVDWGRDDFYATHFLQDERGRRIMIAWLREARPNQAQVAAGWSGIMSLPRVLSLRPDGHLSQQPVPELELLRGRGFHAEAVDLTPTLPSLKSGVQRDCVEIEARIMSLQAGACGLKVRRSPDGEEETAILYDPWAGTLTIDRQRSSLDPTVQRGPQVCPLRLAPGEALALRVFVDRSVVEVVANGGVAVTARIYPTRADSIGVEAVGAWDATHIESLDVWEMKNIW